MGYFLKCWRSRTASWVVMVVAAMVVSAMMSVAVGGSTIEYCLRVEMSPPPPPTSQSGLNKWSYIICRDQFRTIDHYVRAKGKLPLAYVEALCDIFRDDEQQVERYIRRILFTYDFDRLMDGRSCSSIRLQRKPPTPSPSSSI